tara:strand:+ start:620 stop:1144 length:525 start_codon:yes stop_codon:yes gene_type:complete
MSTLKVGTIQDHANSTTALTIDNAGRILTPARPAFRARIGAQTGSAIGAQGDLVFETEDFDIGDNYNVSNGKFTAPIAGIYHFMFRALSATNNTGGANTGGETVFGDLKKNGSAVPGARFYEYQQTGNYHHTFYLNTIIQLNATDYVQININSEFAYADSTAAYDPCFEGYLIG